MNIDIAHNIGQIYEAGSENDAIRRDMMQRNDQMHESLIQVHDKIYRLEEKSNQMSDIFVKSNLSPEDIIYVEKSMQTCLQLQSITETAVDQGILSFYL